MSNNAIHEEDFLSWDEKQREAYTFRLLTEIRNDVKSMTMIKLGCHSIASFVGGVIGGIAATLGASKFKIFG